MCFVSDTGHELTAEIATGIAIAHTRREMAVFFGCIAQRSGYGGAGLVRKRGNQMFVFPLLVNDTQILAGNMILFDYCRSPQINDETRGGGGYRYIFSSCRTLAYSSIHLLYVVLLVQSAL